MNRFRFLFVIFMLSNGAHIAPAFAGEEPTDPVLLAGAGSAVIPFIKGDLIGEGDAIGKGFLRVGGKMFWPGDTAKASAITFSNGDNKFSIVSVDTLNFQSDWVTMIETKLEEKEIYNTNLMITATHGHANINPRFNNALERILNAVVASLEQADRNLQLAKVGFGRGFYMGNLNRVHRVFDAKGIFIETQTKWEHCGGELIEWLFDQGARDPVDHEVGVVHVVNAEANTTIATLVNFAAHPTIFMKGDTPTPDYAGRVRRRLEEHYKAPSLFLQGAAGDMTPKCGVTVEGNPAKLAWDDFSRGLFSSVVSVINNLSNYSNEGNIKYSTKILSYNTPSSGALPGWCGPNGGKRKLYLGAAKLSDRLYLASMSGEPFSQLGKNIKNNNKLDDNSRLTLVLGYTNEADGYFPTADVFRTGAIGTGAGPDGNSCAQNNTGERAVADIGNMLNNL